MNVLVTVPRLDVPGGVASYFNTLRPALAAQVRYFEVGRRAEPRGILATITRLSSDCISLYRTLSAGDFSLVHINPSLLTPSLIRDGLSLLIGRSFGRPVLVMFHGWDKPVQEAIERRWLWLFRRVYGRASAFVVLAEEFKRQLEGWGFRQPIFVDTTAIDDEAAVADLAPLEFRRRESPTFNILFLARLEREKGLFETLDAFATIREAVPEARLVVAGDGPDRAAAEEYVRQRHLPAVEFTGFLTGPSKLEVFRAAHLYLFPTYYGEGMPTSVLEAMGFGLPVITRPVGGLADFFEDRRMGRLTDSTDPRVLAGLVLELAGDPATREKIGRYNATYAAERFTASRVAARIAQIHAQLAGRPAATPT